jgi:alkylated DNA nucleotide flippase Atl1
VWEYSGAAARPTPIVAQALAEAAGITKSPRGPAWWVTEDGRDLPTIAGDSGGGFDWRNLHELLGQIPAGRWVTYGDLADVIGTAAMPVGNHLAKCEQCINAHRVLGGNGKVRPNFAWTDPHEMRTPKDILAAEGVRFTGDVADRAQQLKVEDLRQWVTELPTPPMQ